MSGSASNVSAAAPQRPQACPRSPKTSQAARIGVEARRRVGVDLADMVVIFPIRGPGVRRRGHGQIAPFDAGRIVPASSPRSRPRLLISATLPSAHLGIKAELRYRPARAGSAPPNCCRPAKDRCADAGTSRSRNAALGPAGAGSFQRVQRGARQAQDLLALPQLVDAPRRMTLISTISRSSPGVEPPVSPVFAACRITARPEATAAFSARQHLDQEPGAHHGGDRARCQSGCRAYSSGASRAAVRTFPADHARLISSSARRLERGDERGDMAALGRSVMAVLSRGRVAAGLA